MSVFMGGNDMNVEEKARNLFRIMHDNNLTHWMSESEFNDACYSISTDNFVNVSTRPKEEGKYFRLRTLSPTVRTIGEAEHALVYGNCHYNLLREFVGRDSGYYVRLDWLSDVHEGAIFMSLDIVCGIIFNGTPERVWHWHKKVSNTQEWRFRNSILKYAILKARESIKSGEFETLLMMEVL
jgi:hypothetical protein